MLREFIVLALTAFCLSEALQDTKHTADMDFLHKQKKVYELLLHATPSVTMDPKMYEISHNYDIEADIDSYTNKVAVKHFLQLYKHGMLRKGEIFSMHNPKILDETVALFHLFYSAKDFQTFYKIALWARAHVNGGLFSTALYVAVIHRPDTEYIRLPPLYEVNPYHFFDSNVIHRAHHIKMQNDDKDTVNTYVIVSNYSSGYVNPQLENEYKLDYFVEDIGLNAYYFYTRQIFPPWMNGKEFNLPVDIRGVRYYYLHKQLLTRYYLERLSNDMKDIENFDWNKPFLPGFYTTLMYPNGMLFPRRKSYSMIPEYKYEHLKDIQNFESRILAVIDSGFIIDKTGKTIDIYTNEGMNLLGNIIEGNADSHNPKFYGTIDVLMRNIFGFNMETTHGHKIMPSALQHWSTNLRDPAFYLIYKRIVNYFLRYNAQLTSYTYDELAYPGVKIESVTVDNLITYFDNFDTLVNNVIPMKSQSNQNTKETSPLRIKVQQQRLNHKPFTFHLTVMSSKNTKATVRIYLGPKYDVYHHELDISENYKNFFQLDMFTVTLKPGKNKIERHSFDSILVVPDEESSETFYKKLLKAIEGTEPFTYTEQLYGLPERLQLPKGKKEGMPFQLFVFLSPFDDSKATTIETPSVGKITLEGKPFDFPLDRPMYSFNYTMPNMYFKDVLIYHLKEDEVPVHL